MINRKKITEEILQDFQSLKRKMVKDGQFSFPKFHITPAQWHVLFIVRNHDGINLKEIASILDISSSATTQLIDSLVESGFVIRENDTVDRRSLKIKLSKKHEKLVKEMKQKGMERISVLFSALDDEEISTFYKLFKKMMSR